MPGVDVNGAVLRHDEVPRAAELIGKHRGGEAIGQLELYVRGCGYGRRGRVAGRRTCLVAAPARHQCRNKQDVTVLPHADSLPWRDSYRPTTVPLPPYRLTAYTLNRFASFSGTSSQPRLRSTTRSAGALSP